VSIFNWFRRREQEREKRQGVAHWQSQYYAYKALLDTRLQDYIRATGQISANSVLVGYLMTAEPGEPAEWSKAAPDEIVKAKEIAAAALRDEPEMRHLAADASYSLALLFLMQAFNPGSPTEPHRDLLDSSLVCVKNAIKYGDAPALYHSTAAQTLGTMGDFDRAYEHSQLAVRADPTNPEANRMAGVCATAVDKFEDAEFYLNKAKTLAPSLAGLDEGYSNLRKIKERAQEIDAEAALWKVPEKNRSLIEQAYGGNPDAMGVLAYRYKIGEGVQQNLVLAYKWYFLSAKLGDPTNRHNIGEILHYDRALQANEHLGRNEALQWLRRRGL
jgi:TPR repeat protein